MADTIYRTEWSGPVTNWKYRIDIIGAGTTVFSNPVVKTFPKECLIIKSLDLEYDKLPIALTKIPVMRVNWDTDLIPFDELQEIILNPTKDLLPTVVDSDFIFEHASGSHSYPFTSGTYYKLSINMNTGSGNEWYVVFEGVQSKGIETSDNILNGELDLEIEDLNFFILKRINFDNIKLTSDTFAIGRQAYLDANVDVWDVAYSERQLFQHTVQNNKSNRRFWFIEQWEIFKYINSIGTSMLKAILRDNSTSIKYQVYGPHTKYYKQTYTGAGDIGTQVSSPYIIGVQTDGEEITNQAIDGLFANSPAAGKILHPENGLSNKYKCALDFISDIFKESLCKGSTRYFDSTSIHANTRAITSSEIARSAISNYTTSLAEEIDLNVANRANRAFTLKIKTQAKKLGTVTSSLHEFKVNDIDKFDVKRDSRNEDSDTIPIIFNNMPSATSYKLTNQGEPLCNPCHIKDVIKSQTGEDNTWHLWNLFYLENSADIYESGQPAQMVRVHEYCEVVLKPPTANYPTGYTTNTILPNVEDQFSRFQWYNRFRALHRNATATMMVLQQESCKPKWMAQAWAEMWNQRHQTELSISADFYTLGDYFKNDAVLLANEGFFLNKALDYVYKYDLSNIKSKLSYLPQLYLAESIKLNFETEEFELQLISIPEGT